MRVPRSANLNTREIAKQDLEPGPLPEASAGSLGRFDGGRHEGLSGAVPFSSPTIQSNLDFGSVPIDIVGEITDTPMDFDWVCET